MRHLAPFAIGLAALGGLFACAGEAPKKDVAFNPSYKGIETILLDGDLVNFRVAMTGARDDTDVAAYAACAAAQYALIRGFGLPAMCGQMLIIRVEHGAGMRFTPSRRPCPKG